MVYAAKNTLSMMPNTNNNIKSPARCLVFGLTSMRVACEGRFLKHRCSTHQKNRLELQPKILFDEYICRLFRYKKKILELAKQHDKASEVEKVQRYQMPSEKGELNAYLEEDLKEKVIILWGC